MKSNDKTPNADWNTDSLLRAHRDTTNTIDETIAIACLIANRLDDITSGNFNSVLVATSGGNWARGNDLIGAVRTLKARRTEIVFAWLVQNATCCWVDSYGGANASSRACLTRLGKIGTVGSIINANK